MRHNKIIKITIQRTKDNYTLSKRKKRKIKNLLARNISKIASHFNGTVEFTILISAKDDT
jgi:hemerythrin